MRILQQAFRVYTDSNGLEKCIRFYEVEYFEAARKEHD
jgi:hypothetical protein